MREVSANLRRDHDDGRVVRELGEDGGDALTQRAIALEEQGDGTLSERVTGEAKTGHDAGIVGVDQEAGRRRAGAGSG